MHGKYSGHTNHLPVIITLVITALLLHTRDIPDYILVDSFVGLACAFAFTLEVPSAWTFLSLTYSFIPSHSFI